MKENGYGTWENNNAWETQGLRQTEEEHERQELKAARSHFSKLGGMFILGTIVIVAVQTLVSYLAGVADGWRHQHDSVYGSHVSDWHAGACTLGEDGSCGQSGAASD